MRQPSPPRLHGTEGDDPTSTTTPKENALLMAMKSAATKAARRAARDAKRSETAAVAAPANTRTREDADAAVADAIERATNEELARDPGHVTAVDVDGSRPAARKAVFAGLIILVASIILSVALGEGAPIAFGVTAFAVIVGGAGVMYSRSAKLVDEVVAQAWNTIAALPDGRDAYHLRRAFVAAVDADDRTAAIRAGVIAAAVASEDGEAPALGAAELLRIANR